MVVSLDGKVLLGVFLDFGYDGIIGRPWDIRKRDGSWLVKVRLPFEDGIGVDGDGGPAVEGDGVCVGAHGVGLFLFW